MSVSERIDRSGLSPCHCDPGCDCRFDNSATAFTSPIWKYKPGLLSCVGDVGPNPGHSGTELPEHGSRPDRDGCLWIFGLRPSDVKAFRLASGDRLRNPHHRVQANLPIGLDVDVFHPKKYPRGLERCARS